MKRIAVVVLLLLMGACSSPMEPGAFAVAPELACTNTPVFTTFQVVYLVNGVTPDTTPVYVDRMAVPHVHADTVALGLGARLIFTNNAEPGWCLTLMDSLSHHMPHAVRAFGQKG